MNLYTKCSSSSCRLAKKWLTAHKVPFTEKNTSKGISEAEIKAILQRTEAGFESILSKRSTVYKRNKLKMAEMTFNELVKFLSEHPSAIKLPILLDGKKLVVDYNEEQIRTFLPKETKRAVREYALKRARALDGGYI